MQPQQGLDLIQPHDHGTMDAEEVRRIETLFEGLHALADDVGAIAHVNFGVRATGGDVLDGHDGHDPHLAAHFDGDPLQVSGCDGVGQRDRRGGRRAAGVQHGAQLVGELAEFGEPDHLARAPEGLLEALVVEGLHEVVDGCDIEGIMATIDLPLPPIGERLAALGDIQFEQLTFGGGKASRDEHDLRELKSYAVAMLQYHNMEVQVLRHQKRKFWRPFMNDTTLRHLYETACFHRDQKEVRHE